jgi:uncharacterized membrane protein YgcG
MRAIIKNIYGSDKLMAYPRKKNTYRKKNIRKNAKGTLIHLLIPYSIGIILSSYLYSINWILVSYLVGFIVATIAIIMTLVMNIKSGYYITIPILIVLSSSFYTIYGGWGFLFILIIIVVLLVLTLGGGASAGGSSSGRRNSSRNSCDGDFGDSGGESYSPPSSRNYRDSDGGGFTFSD